MSDTQKRPGRTGITYEQVVAAANALLADNRRATLRGVREALGTGSPGTIQKHLARFEEQRPGKKPADIAISAEILRGLGDEVRRHVSNATVVLNEQLADAASARDLLAEQSYEQALLVADLESQIEALTVQTTQQTALLEALRTAESRERAAAEQSRVSLAEANLRLEGVPAFQAELERLRGQLENRVDELSLEKARSSGLMAERDSLGKQLEAAGQRQEVADDLTQRLHAELQGERERTNRAETRAATAEAHDLATGARIIDLQEQLKASATREVEAVRRADRYALPARGAVT